MIEVIEKLCYGTMTSTWILHAKRLFELESRRCHFSIEQRAPYENSDITKRSEDQKGPGTLLNYPRKSDSLQTAFAPMQVRRPEHGRVSEVPVRCTGFQTMVTSSRVFWYYPCLLDWYSEKYFRYSERSGNSKNNWYEITFSVIADLLQFEAS